MQGKPKGKNISKNFYKKVSLYIARTGKHHDIKDSAPCVDCLNTIKQLNIKKIIYTMDNNIINSCKPCDFHTEHTTLGRRHLADVT